MVIEMKEHSDDFYDFNEIVKKMRKDFASALEQMQNMMGISLPSPNLEQDEPENSNRTTHSYSFGFEAAVGPDGIPRIRTFNSNPQATLSGNSNTLSAERETTQDGFVEPFTDINYNEDESSATIHMEMPGISQDDVVIKGGDTYLIIEASTGEKKYRKHLNLAFKTKRDSISASFKNGVLELMITKDNEKESEFTVDLE